MLVFLKKLLAKHLGFEEANGVIEQLFVAVFSVSRHDYLQVGVVVFDSPNRIRPLSYVGVA